MKNRITRETFAGLAFVLFIGFPSGARSASGVQAGNSGSWITLPPMPVARQEVSTAALNGKVYVIAGYDSSGNSTDTVQVFDSLQNSWSSAARLPIPTNHNAAAVAAGKLYAFGGTSNLVFLYGPQQDRWSEVAPMRFIHGGTPAVAVIDDRIYVAGGTGDAMQGNEVEVYDPGLNAWTLLAPMNIPRNHTAGGAIAGRFYVAGGRGSPTAADALEVYDPQRNVWGSLAPMPTGRSGVGAAVVNGELYVFGGEQPRLFSEVEAYIPATNTWRQLPPMPTPRHGIFASVIGNVIYLPGGATQQGFGATNVNEAFVPAPPNSPFGAVAGAGRDSIVTGGGHAGGPRRAVEKMIRVYVAGESIEQRNRFVEAPFAATGALNDRGGGEQRNDDDEYGWMVPMADRLRFRDGSLRLEFVGSDTWLDAEDQPYSGTYPSTVPGGTSAISGTDIPSWLEQRMEELLNRTHCYDIAFASRGGNDFGSYDDEEYKELLKRLVRLLDAGSSCRAHPLIYVTAHMPDDQRGEGGDPDDREYVRQQIHNYVERTRDAVTEIRATLTDASVRFVDMYTPFVENRHTTAFPHEVWAINGVPDYVKIGRVGDPIHPRRLASIYAGEIVADALDLTELHQLP